MRTAAFAAAALLLAANWADAQTDAQRKSAALRDRAAQVENASTDASLRSPIAVPTVELTAEIADDKKTATAKAGFSWKDGLTTEVGVTGAFDKTADRSPITSLRALTPGSSVWVATTWKKYGVEFDPVAEDAVCRQAAWAAGQGFADFDCDEASLTNESYAERLAAIRNSEDAERGICQQFQRAVLSGNEVTSGAGHPPACSLQERDALVRQYGARFTQSYAERYRAAQPAGGSTQAALDVCNEFRRSTGHPPDSHCDPSDFGASEKKAWGRSWQDRITNIRREQEAAVCDEYRRAKGELPTGQPDCAPHSPDPVFAQSFKARYKATYRWLTTPIVSGRLDATRTTFKYFNDALVAQKETHGIYSVTGTAGLLFVNDTFAGVSYSWGRDWKAQDKTELCQPFKDTAAQTCQEGVVIGAPAKKGRNQLEGQLKGYLGPSFGAAVFVTRDFDKDAWGVEVPVYFIKDKSGGLAGGLVASYRTDDKAFVVSVFVGQVFSVF